MTFYIKTIEDALELSDVELVEAAYDFWLESGDCTFSAYDVQNQDSEDDRAEQAERELEDFFHFSFIFGLDDPDEKYAEGFDDETEKRLDRLACDFALDAINGIIEDEELYNEMMSLPR